MPQFLWSGLQAIEKYLKCILLLNRIPARNLRHDLGKALALLDNRAPFKLRLHPASRKLINHLDTFGRFRYLETPFYVLGLELMQLDSAVWDVRRYCRVINYEIALPNGERRSMLLGHLRAIEESDTDPRRPFPLVGGKLEAIIADKKHAARGDLLWKNLFFGSRVRKAVRLRQRSHATNSPLSLHPEILDEVMKYVYLPREVVLAYRAKSARPSTTGEP